MRLEEVLARRLAAEIDAELANLDALEREFEDRPLQDDSYSLRARGSIVHDLYAGVERILVRIAHELNGGVPQAEQWHQQLIEDMRLDIPEVRPAVIDSTLAATLGEYLRFRHVSRNVYGSAALEENGCGRWNSGCPRHWPLFANRFARSSVGCRAATERNRKRRIERSIGWSHVCVRSPPGWNVRTSA